MNDQEIKLSMKTLIRVIMENGEEYLITRALLIDSGNTPVVDDKEILVEMQSSSFPTDRMYFVDKDGKKISWGKYPCEVLKVNPYKTGNEYLVLLPNGNTTWTSYNPNATPTRICKEIEGIELASIPELLTDCGGLCTE